VISPEKKELKKANVRGFDFAVFQNELSPGSERKGAVGLLEKCRCSCKIALNYYSVRNQLK
jgi:hypothetical protein